MNASASIKKLLRLSLSRARYDNLRRRLREIRRSARTEGLLAPVNFRLARRTRAYQSVYDKVDPLVSITITTYNCSDLLINRALRSCLAQTYKNIEIIIVGDACTDDTDARMLEVTDPRVRYVNLEKRGDYPSDPGLRWFVAGCKPFNHGLEMARGDYITHLDHDDEFVEDRIEILVAHMRAKRVDILFHPFAAEMPDGAWTINPAHHFDLAQVTTSSVFYHRHFAAVTGDMKSYELLEPGDWNRFRRMRYLGAKALRVPHVLTRHYKERTALAR